MTLVQDTWDWFRDHDFTLLPPAGGDGSLLRFDTLTDANDIFSVLVQVREQGQIHMHSFTGAYATEEAMPETMQQMLWLVNRINEGIVVGKWVVNADSEEIELSTVIDMADVPREAFASLMKNMVYTNLAEFKRWLPVIQGVVGGGDAVALYDEGVSE